MFAIERPGGGGCQEHGKAIPRDKIMAWSGASPREWLHVPQMTELESWGPARPLEPRWFSQEPQIINGHEGAAGFGVSIPCVDFCT